MGKDIFKKSIYENLFSFSERSNLHIPEEIISYISSVLALYYKGFPLYLIDVQETNVYRKNKIRGDLSLLLVGFFREWVNRKNRPLTENDYINTGKISYMNAYLYLEATYGDIFNREIEKEYIKYISENLNTYLDILKSMSENFEFYTQFLNSYKEEAKKVDSFLSNFPDLRVIEIKKIFED